MIGPKTVKVVKEDVVEVFEIERSKMNLLSHGVTETDAEKDIGQIEEILASDGLLRDMWRK